MADKQHNLSDEALAEQNANRQVDGKYGNKPQSMFTPDVSDDMFANAVYGNVEPQIRDLVREEVSRLAAEGAGSKPDDASQQQLTEAAKVFTPNRHAPLPRSESEVTLEPFNADDNPRARLTDKPLPGGYAGPTKPGRAADVGLVDDHGVSSAADAAWDAAMRANLRRNRSDRGVDYSKAGVTPPGILHSKVPPYAEANIDLGEFWSYVEKNDGDTPPQTEPIRDHAAKHDGDTPPVAFATLFAENAIRRGREEREDREDQERREAERTNTAPRKKRLFGFF